MLVRAICAQVASPCVLVAMLPTQRFRSSQPVTHALQLPALCKVRKDGASCLLMASARSKARATRQWTKNFIDSLIAVLAGNAAYFLLLPNLPEAARHVPFKTDLGLLVDGWFCLVAFGLVKLARKGKGKFESRRN